MKNRQRKARQRNFTIEVHACRGISFELIGLTKKERDRLERKGFTQEGFFDLGWHPFSKVVASQKYGYETADVLILVDGVKVARPPAPRRRCLNGKVSDPSSFGTLLGTRIEKDVFASTTVNAPVLESLVFGWGVFESFKLPDGRSIKFSKLSLLSHPEADWHEESRDGHIEWCRFDEDGQRVELDLESDDENEVMRW